MDSRNEGGDGNGNSWIASVWAGSSVGKSKNTNTAKDKEMVVGTFCARAGRGRIADASGNS